jgi:hypothetical protein
MAESSLNALAEHLQTTVSEIRDDFSPGAVLLFLVGALFQWFQSRDPNIVQTFVDTILAGVFDEVRKVSAFMAMRDAVLNDLREKGPPRYVVSSIHCISSNAFLAPHGQSTRASRYSRIRHDYYWKTFDAPPLVSCGSRLFLPVSSLIFELRRALTS